ncbi:DUF928 domain-containing protein [Parathermosynechococcus lividus]
MRHLVTLVPAIALALLPLTVGGGALAQSAPIVVSQANSLAARLRANLPNRGAPGSRFGGATRGSCVMGNQRLTALLPNTNLGQTAVAKPTFFVFVPTSTASQGELVITDPQNRDVSTTVVRLPAQPGILALQPTVELNPGQDYRWSFTLLCGADADDPSAMVSVSGVVERIQPRSDLAKKLAASNVGDRLSAAVDAGLWYETLAILADLQRQTTTKDMARSEWQAVLNAVGLEAIAQAPLVQ